MPTHTWRRPNGVVSATELKRRCATQLSGERSTCNRVFSQSTGCINSRILTVSPVLHNAVLSNQPSSLDHGASRGSRVSGSKARQVANCVESFSHTSGNRLLSEMTAGGGFATRVLPPRKKCFHPVCSGNRESHSA